MKEENRIRGFEVYLIDDGWQSRSDYAITDDGKLLRKTSNGYTEVPQRGEYLIIHCGKAERW